VLVTDRWTIREWFWCGGWIETYIGQFKNATGLPRAVVHTLQKTLAVKSRQTSRSKYSGECRQLIVTILCLVKLWCCSIEQMPGAAALHRRYWIQLMLRGHSGRCVNRVILLNCTTYSERLANSYHGYQWKSLIMSWAQMKRFEAVVFYGSQWQTQSQG
jgi:hypothetical protein